MHKTLLNLLNRDSTRYYPFLVEDVKAEHKITPVYIKKVNKLPLPKLKPNKYFDSQFGRGRRSRIEQYPGDYTCVIPLKIWTITGGKHDRLPRM